MSLQQIQKLLEENERLKARVLELEKIVSDGFAEYFKLFQETKRLKEELERAKFFISSLD